MLPAPDKLVSNTAGEQERTATNKPTADSLYLLQTGRNTVMVSSVEMVEQRQSFAGL